MAPTFGTFTKDGRTRTATNPEQAVRFRYAGWTEVTTDDDQVVDGTEIPPRGGAGSGRDAWFAYATAHGVDVPEDANRDDIISALDAAGVATGDE